ncbi:exportin 47-related [Holotrichia oblita]|uniref:Exportin 47-related n=1 Tax=Holotrichia oblita TaxID=644536 RepID=A0ACB9ST34_HOLOL|nr:exportin 47-related [Holotrichia oblita]
MNTEFIRELESAANILMAPPNVVTNEQRHAAETIIINFRKSKSPYVVCREILENSQVQYIMFEAAELLKSALIREWSFLQESDIISLRQYLMHYVMNRNSSPFVQERLLQVIAIMIKRGSVEDLGQERGNILSEVENLIIGADSAKQVLGCKVILNLMQEYSITVKTTDVGLPWEVHYKAKRQFEATDLKRIFQFCVQVLSEIIKSDAFRSPNILNLIKIIGVYESVYEADQAPPLRLAVSWKDIMLAPQLLPLMFQVYWKVRDHDELAHHAMTCLVQLASLNGGVVSNEDVKMQYLTAYMENFLKLITSVNIKNKESLGISNIVRKLELFFSSDLTKLPQNLQESYLDDITRLTCAFAEGASLEEAEGSDNKYYMESFDNMLEAWTTILKDFKDGANDYLSLASMRVFNTYLQCHLAPPGGTRTHNDDQVEEIEDNEDNDRIKFRDQLQTIGMFGRVILDHSLPVLYKLLEERIEKLRAHFQAMQTQAMTIAESTNLDNLFEDVHWIILIAGHVLCMDSEGETPVIPSEVMRYCLQQCTNSVCTLDATLKVMASVQQFTNDLDCVDQCDHVIRIFCDVLKLCFVETSAAEIKLGHFTSPEVGCTMMWFLNRWCLSYLMPIESFYDEIPQTFKGGLVKDTEGAIFLFNLVLQKIQANICHFNSEPILLQDTLNLFCDICSVRHKSIFLCRSEGIWNLINLHGKLEAGVLPSVVRRGLCRGFVMAGATIAYQEEIDNYYGGVLKPLQQRFKNLLCQENFNKIYQEERVKNEVIDILEGFVGVAKGTQMTTVHLLFDFLAPMLAELPKFMKIYNNYQVIVQLILELFGQCAKCMLCYLSQLDSKRLYESTLATIQTYTKCNENRFTTEALSEESSFQDLTLTLDLLTYILSKDCLDLSPANPNEEVTITAADISLFGLNFIMPLMTTDLLKYPSLCAQYYRLIVLINDIFPEKVCNLPEELLTKVLISVEYGLTQFGSDIVQASLDFLQGMATYTYKNGMQNSNIHQKLLPFLKLLLDLTLSHQINSDIICTASCCIYALICCYGEQYNVFVQNLIQSQSDPLTAERLTAAFNQLMNNVPLDGDRFHKMKFRDNFDKFISNVHGFLLVK